MRKFNVIAPALIAILLITILISCGKSSSDTSDIYIPDIDGNWLNQADANNQFSFFDAPNNAATGSFSGNEFENGTVIGQFTGNFTHSKVSFTITFSDNSVPSVTYSGTISGSSNPVMSLSSSKGKLVIKKQ